MARAPPTVRAASTNACSCAHDGAANACSCAHDGATFLGGTLLGGAFLGFVTMLFGWRRFRRWW